jgi:hypothetical protein
MFEKAIKRQLLKQIRKLTNNSPSQVIITGVGGGLSDRTELVNFVLQEMNARGYVFEGMTSATRVATVGGRAMGAEFSDMIFALAPRPDA